MHAVMNFVFKVEKKGVHRLMVTTPQYQEIHIFSIASCCLPCCQRQLMSQNSINSVIIILCQLQNSFSPEKSQHGNTIRIGIS